MAQTLEEKIAKARETAMKKAEKDGLDEDATNALIADAVAKVQEAWKKAADQEAKAKEAAQPNEYTVKVKNNPEFCGIGAGGVQFANGEAHITSDRMAAWFREHEGYEVIER